MLTETALEPSSSGMSSVAMSSSSSSSASWEIKPLLFNNLPTKDHQRSRHTRPQYLTSYSLASTTRAHWVPDSSISGVCHLERFLFI